MSVALVVDNDPPSLRFLLEDLAKSGLDPEDFQLTNSDQPGILPFEPSPDSPKKLYGYTINFPVETHDGYIPNFFVKRYANNAAHKYEGAKGATYPYWATPYDEWVDAKVKYIVEGEKKAIAFRKYTGLPVVGIRGCWGFMRSAEGEATDGGAPMVELLDGIYKGDKVYVLMDGDLMTKHDIRRAAGKIGRAHV